MQFASQNWKFLSIRGDLFHPDTPGLLAVPLINWFKQSLEKNMYITWPYGMKTFISLGQSVTIRVNWVAVRIWDRGLRKKELTEKQKSACAFSLSDQHIPGLHALNPGDPNWQK